MITEGSSKKVVILAFNLGISGRLVNGPGISLRNLLLSVNAFYPNVSFSIFTECVVTERFEGLRLYNIKDKYTLKSEIETADVVHCWSGLREDFLDGVKVANSLFKRVILGPNLLDSVDLGLEKKFLKEISK